MQNKIVKPVAKLPIVKVDVKPTKEFKDPNPGTFIQVVYGERVEIFESKEDPWSSFTSAGKKEGAFERSWLYRGTRVGGRWQRFNGITTKRTSPRWWNPPKDPLLVKRISLQKLLDKAFELGTTKGRHQNKSATFTRLDETARRMVLFSLPSNELTLGLLSA